MHTNMWEQTETLARKLEADTSHWLKLSSDGDKTTLVFLGEPFPREVAFVDGKSVPFDEKLQGMGHKPSLRIAFNVALYDTGEVKVLEQGVTFFRDLLRVREHYGLEKWSFEVERHGAANDPKTTYSILPERQLSAVERSAYRKLALLDLPRLYAGNPDAVPMEPDGPGLGLDPVLVDAIATQLRAMPSQAIDRFLQAFDVARISELRAGQRDKAVAFVRQLISELDVTRLREDDDIDRFD
jgi:hypothetical protein